MHQRRLERLPRPFHHQLRRRQLPQFLIHQWQAPLSGLWIAGYSWRREKARVTELGAWLDGQVGASRNGRVNLNPTTTSGNLGAVVILVSPSLKDLPYG